VIVSPLRKALCSRRDRHSIERDPNTWVAAALPRGWGLYSFHFFVDWRKEPPPVSDTILMARLVDFEADENLNSISNQILLNAFIDSKSDVYFDNLEAVMKPYSKKVVPILLPECAVTNIVNETPIWTVSRDSADNYTISRSNVEKLKISIQKHSGGKVWVGEKGLIYGTSAIECALSKTDSAFPGDADAVIVNDNGRVHCIVEYKKHTLDQPLGDHLFTRYYPFPDGRKFQRLSSLASNLNQFAGGCVNLVVIYYSLNLLQMRVQTLGRIDANIIEVVRDSGDFSINGLSDLEVSKALCSWLEVR
jgi:hypothetical protein